MHRIYRIIILLLTCAFSTTTPSFAQRHRLPEDQIKLGQRFFAQDEVCRNLLKAKQWKEAEAACRKAVLLAERFADHRELEKLGAYESVGRSLTGQGLYQEAIRNYLRAIEVARPRLDDTSAEIGSLYLDIAVAYHGLRDLNRAREYYRRAEKTYRIAYDGINPEEVTIEGVEMKRGYARALKRIFEYHLLAAEQAGAEAEAAEIKEEMNSLPQ